MRKEDLNFLTTKLLFSIFGLVRTTIITNKHFKKKIIRVEKEKRKLDIMTWINFIIFFTVLLCISTKYHFGIYFLLKINFRVTSKLKTLVFFVLYDDICDTDIYFSSVFWFSFNVYHVIFNIFPYLVYNSIRPVIVSSFNQPLYTSM